MKQYTIPRIDTVAARAAAPGAAQAADTVSARPQATQRSFHWKNFGEALFDGLGDNQNTCCLCTPRVCNISLFGSKS